MVWECGVDQRRWKSLREDRRSGPGRRFSLGAKGIYLFIGVPGGGLDGAGPRREVRPGPSPRRWERRRGAVASARLTGSARSAAHWLGSTSLPALGSRRRAERAPSPSHTRDESVHARAVDDASAARAAAEPRQPSHW